MDTLRSIMSDLEQRLSETVTLTNKHTRGWLLVFFDSLKEILSFQASMMAAATAYFTLFSIFPLLLITVATASIWFDPLPAGTTILERLEFVVPAISDLLGENLTQIVQARAALTRLSALTLIWSASSAVYVLTRALDGIWVVETERPAWRHRALAIVVTLALSVFLWIGSFAWSVVVPLVNRFLPDALSAGFSALNAVGSALLSVLVFAILYYMLPHARLRWREVIIGALIAGLLWELAKRVFLVFITNFLTLSNLLYGSVAAIIAFLTWVYVSSLIFLFGAQVNFHYKQLRQARRSAATKT